MSEFTPSLFGLVPAVLKPKTRRILLENFELPLDIGFHDFEIGNPQRLVVTIEVWLDEASFADSDQADRAWKYDFLRSGVVKLVEGRRSSEVRRVGKACVRTWSYRWTRY